MEILWEHAQDGTPKVTAGVWEGFMEKVTLVRSWGMNDGDRSAYVTKILTEM